MMQGCSIKKQLLLLIGLVCVTGVSAKPLSVSLKEVIQSDLSTASVGVMVMDAKSGETLFDYNARRVLTPASNTKLFSQAAALYGLGPHYRYTTVLATDAEPKAGRINNLYLTFVGDPSLTTQNLSDMLQVLKQKQITTITGDILIDAQRFSPPNHPAGLSYEDLHHRYAAPVSSIIIDGNAAGVTITANKTLGKPAMITSDRNNRWLKFTNSVVSVPESVAKGQCDLDISEDQNNTLHFSGCIGLTLKPQHEMIALRDPFLRVKSIITDYLRHNDIVFRGKVMLGSSKSASRILQKHQSNELKNLVVHTLKESDNLYADAILKTLGAKYYGHGSYHNGVESLKAVLGKQTDIDFTKMDIRDGAGTRYNLISPQAIARLLYVIYHDPEIKTYFQAALPNAGTDGTLKRRFNAFDLKQHIYAKTGTFHDVSSLSGYLRTRSNRELIFSIIINNVVDDVKKAKRLEDALCSEMIRSV